jgi:hypothetical protein
VVSTDGGAVVTERLADKRHLNDLSDPQWCALVQLLVEQGYLSPDGYLTPLGDQYIDAMDIEEPPNRLDPSGGKVWSDIPDF